MNHSSTSPLVVDATGDAVFGELTPLSSAQVPHSSSHNIASLEGDYDALESVDPEILEMSRRTPAKMGSLAPTAGMSKDLIKLFRAKPAFNYRSIVEEGSTELLEKLENGCDLASGYEYHLPRGRDRLWHTPKEGWQGVPLIFFDMGFRLPMHPLFAAVYRVLCCGIAQLAPNAIAQISGVIARCHDLEKIPTVDLLLSIYQFKSAGGQLYLDKKPKRVRLVNVRPSHSGWQERWAYLVGGDLGSVGPWNDVSQSWLRVINSMPSSFTDEYLKSFHGTTEQFSSDQLSKEEFLETHCRKDFVSLLSSICYAWFLIVLFVVQYLEKRYER